MVQSCASADAFSGIIDDLYAGTLDDAAWGRAIVGIADCVRASGAVLLAFNPSNGAILRYENHRLDPQITIAYQKHWTYEDVRRKYFLGFPTCAPLTEGMMSDDSWGRTAILNEFLKPMDIPYFMPVWLHKAPDKLVTLSYQGTCKRGPFGSEDIETYRQIAPHVSRALEIRDRLQQLQVRADTLARQLDTLRFGVGVLDSAGRILEANAVLRHLLGADSGIWRGSDGRLCLRGPANVQLQRWICRGAPPANNADGLLRVPRSNAAALSVLVTPLAAPSSSWMGPDPGWLVLVFDPNRNERFCAELIASDLGISAREAEVAARLASGLNLRDVARCFGVSEHTVRAQLKSIFRRTGIRSQSDLVRRVTLGPAGSVEPR